MVATSIRFRPNFNMDITPFTSAIRHNKPYNYKLFKLAIYEIMDKILTDIIKDDCDSSYYYFKNCHSQIMKLTKDFHFTDDNRRFHIIEFEGLQCKICPNGVSGITGEKSKNLSDFITHHILFHCLDQKNRNYRNIKILPLDKLKQHMLNQVWDFYENDKARIFINL